MIPANQSLDADQAGGVYLRLIVQYELLSVDCLVKVLFDGYARVGRMPQVRGKEAHGVTALGLGLMQGQFSLLHDLMRGSRFTAEDGDADVAMAVIFLAGKGIRL